MAYAKKRKRRGGGAFPLGPIDEIFNPTRYEAQLELDRQTVLPAPAPVPGDPGAEEQIYSGKVTIDLTARSGRDTPGDAG